MSGRWSRRGLSQIPRGEAQHLFHGPNPPTVISAELVLPYTTHAAMTVATIVVVISTIAAGMRHQHRCGRCRSNNTLLPTRYRTLTAPRFTAGPPVCVDSCRPIPTNGGSPNLTGHRIRQYGRRWLPLFMHGYRWSHALPLEWQSITAAARMRSLPNFFVCEFDKGEKCIITRVGKLVGGQTDRQIDLLKK